MRALRSHIGLVHNRRISCDLCGNTFSYKQLLIDHMQTHHINIKFSCNLCFAEFQSNLQLSKHNRESHNNDVKYKCEECDVEFCELSFLAQHVKVLHEAQRFHCSYPGCLKTFSSKSHSTRHHRLIHSLDRGQETLKVRNYLNR